ncbi:hypothetical protein DPMN_024794 [Dreissena polymorpha]|uniref:Uncharacterized protein n=2 Tax=Dreissena polymorpha TaxID=45954 RepID=A0A9D4LQG1_DREPO|nr:hypothetical protein DPMN_024794 [Dreissena polymorpha]
MTGYNFRREYLNDSAIAFRFDDAYGLHHTFALEVSDHYPIELQLKDRVTSSGLTIVTLPSGYDIIFLMFSYTRMYMEI